MNGRRRIAVRMAGEVVATLRRHARPGARRERGGLLLGWWDPPDVTIRCVVEVSDPDATETTWTRHELAAQEALDRARATHPDPRVGYVGDWHTHPARIGASPTDEMALLRASRQYPQPTVLIVVLPDGSLDIRAAHAGRIRPAHLTIEPIQEYPVTLPARAAAIRGDDYQHIIGWYWACQALVDPDIISVSIEDVAGGAFDDLVVLRHTEADCYDQIKSSNTDETIVTAAWLTTPTATNGKSPLQHFYTTWAAHHQETRRPLFRLITNRAFDPNDPIFKLRDKHSNTVTRLLQPKTPRSAAGKQRKAWATHLGITEAELLNFLTEFELHHEGGETSWFRQARDAMRGAGLRTDDDAVIRGRDLIRDWVKTGAGPQTCDAIRRRVVDADLLARKGTLIFAIHAIDRPAHNLQPAVTLDFVDLYEGATDRERRQLRNPEDWQNVVVPSLAKATTDLESFGIRRAHIIGAMRLPMWFAIGAWLPSTRGWVISADQNNVEWRSDTPPADVAARKLGNIELAQGPDLAVVVALTHEITTDVAEYLHRTNAPVNELLSLGPTDGASQTAVPDAAFAVGWAHAARTRIRDAVKRTNAPRLHLFFAAPQGAALMLGHHWNLMPPAILFEHLGNTYSPSMTIR